MANVRKIAIELALQEGLTHSQTVAQIAELLGLLGERWREMPTEIVAAELYALVSRAGKRSAHRRRR